jgi:hypothetical protein
MLRLQKLDSCHAWWFHVICLAIGWINGHLHSFCFWSKEYEVPYADGICFAENARRVHPGDFLRWANGTFTYDFGNYSLNQAREEKVPLPTALEAENIFEHDVPTWFWT